MVRITVRLGEGVGGPFRQGPADKEDRPVVDPPAGIRHVCPAPVQGLRVGTGVVDMLR